MDNQELDLPLVSVIVPVFNDAPGLARLLDSLCQQSNKNFEVVVVDNGSDPPVTVDGDYPLQARLLRCMTPGSYAARNHGVGAAIGDVLAFIDADCTADPNWLKHGLSALDASYGTAVIGGDVLFNEPEPRNGVSLYQIAVGFQQQLNIESHGFSATANLICTAEQFHRIGPFDERLLSGGDREWAWRGSAAGIGVVFEPRCIVRTAPRTSWATAIRQTRRVAAGRLHLQQHDLIHAGARALQPHRNNLQSLIWVLTRSHFSTRERISMLIAAIALKGVSVAEQLRIRLGFRPERR